MKFIVAYDIVSDRTRDKAATCLEDYGDRVQRSVFEVDIDHAQYDTMVSRLEKLIDEEEDSVRIYALCSTCVERARILGLGEILKDERVIVV